MQVQSRENSIENQEHSQESHHYYAQINQSDIFQKEMFFQGRPRTSKVPYPYIHPYKAIGLLKMLTHVGETGEGTAFLIGRNVALTAAHCVFVNGKCISQQNIKFFLNKQEGYHRPFKVYMPEEYKKTNNNQYNYDYAVLIFDENLERYSQISLSSQHIENKSQIQVPGYQVKCRQLVHHKANLAEVTDRLLLHYVDTFPGQSGSPILRKNKQKGYEAIGIHIGFNLSNRNIGIRITEQVKKNINKWIKEYEKYKCIKESEKLDEELMHHHEPPLVLVPMDQQVLGFELTPDTTCYALKNRFYKQDQKNKGVCTRTAQKAPQWLCSNDLPSEGQFNFSINVKKVGKQKERSKIAIGIMLSRSKIDSFQNTFGNSIYLCIARNVITSPNKLQKSESCTKSQQAQVQTLYKLPCKIEFFVNRNTKEIAWHYNGTPQAKSSFPQNWKHQNICAAVLLVNQGDSIQML